MVSHDTMQACRRAMESIRAAERELASLNLAPKMRPDAVARQFENVDAMLVEARGRLADAKAWAAHDRRRNMRAIP